MSDQLSLMVSQALDYLGYSEDMIKFRRDVTSKRNFVTGLYSHRDVWHRMLSGSKAEGTSRYTESDFDYLYILTGVRTTECAGLDPLERDLVFLMDSTTAPPGYCKLELLQEGVNNGWHLLFLYHYDCYVKSSSYRWQISSTKLLKGFHKESTPTSGPSSPLKRPGYPDKDQVLAIKCTTIPSPLQVWFSRHRVHGWPTSDLLQQMSLLPVYVVPVGMAGTAEKYLQWRISFNMLEKVLILNFKTIQCKVYILLKMIFKQVVQTLYPDTISSYIVKTLMFWSIEQTSPHFWTEPNLLEILAYLISRLREFVWRANCPNYFIPANNLLKSKLTLYAQEGICGLLTSLLSEGPSCILRCTQIYQQINLFFSPRVGVIVKDQRNTDERIKLNGSIMEEIHIQCNRIITLMLDSHNPPTTTEFLAELVSTAATLEPKKKKICKYIFRRTIQRALHDYVHNTTSDQRNTRVYRNVQKTLRRVYCNSDTDIMSGKVVFAKVLHLTGQVGRAQKILVDSFSKNRYYTFRLTRRKELRKHLYHPLIEFLVQSDNGFNYMQFIKLFTLFDIKYESAVSVCLPKAVQYEFYRTCDEKQITVEIDSDLLGHYLRYLCHKELGQMAHANAALLNLVWCATQWESGIEYREVALNVLGHCFMEMKKYQKAMKCLVKSVQLREKFPDQIKPTGHAAVWHIAILLNKTFRRQ